MHTVNGTLAVDAVYLGCANFWSHSVHYSADGTVDMHAAEHCLLYTVSILEAVGWGYSVQGGAHSRWRLRDRLVYNVNAASFSYCIVMFSGCRKHSTSCAPRWHESRRDRRTSCSAAHKYVIHISTWSLARIEVTFIRASRDGSLRLWPRQPTTLLIHGLEMWFLPARGKREYFSF